MSPTVSGSQDHVPSGLTFIISLLRCLKSVLMKSFFTFLPEMISHAVGGGLTQEIRHGCAFICSLDKQLLKGSAFIAPASLPLGWELW